MERLGGRERGRVGPQVPGGFSWHPGERRGDDLSDDGGLAALYTVPASAMRGVLEAARAFGLDASGWLPDLGVDPASLESPETRIAEPAYHRVWALLEAGAGDPDLGLHLGERMAPESFDVLGHLVARSRTLGEGMKRVVAYSRLLHDAGRIDVEVDGQVALVHPGCRGLRHDWPRQIAEYSAAATVVLFRAVTGHPVVPRAVSFKHAHPGRLAEHVRVLGVEPSFSEPETVLAFDAGVLELEVRGADPALVTYLDAYARAALERLPRDDSFTSRAERAVADRMQAGLPSLEEVARALSMTPRTLQRRLADEETSWQGVLDGVRRTWGEEMLAEDRLPIAEISFLLGFADPSNFHRAFRRWTGRTPAEHRAARQHERS